MAIENGFSEYYRFLCFGERSLGLTLQMLASNYRYRVLVSELDQEEIWVIRAMDIHLKVLMYHR